MLTQSDIKKLREELKKDSISKKEIQQMFRDFADEITDFMTPSLKKIDDICEKLEDKVFAT